MSSKTTLNAKHLQALGVERLAALLIEISTGNANHKRRLRMELAGHSSGVELAREVRKRLGSIARAKSWIDWKKVKPFCADLENQRRTIVEKIAPHDPEEGFELIWQFLSLADSIFERSGDGSGTLIERFHAASDDAGHIAMLAGIPKDRLVEKVFNALQDNGYGQFDRLIDSMRPALGDMGLRQLQTDVEAWAAEPEPIRSVHYKQIIGWSSTGPIYEDRLHADDKSMTAQFVLQQIADALGDVDLFIAQYPAHTHIVPRISTEIAQRLLAAGRAEEALRALDKAEFDGRRDVLPEWQATRADVLEALGHSEDAQQFRWQCFEQTLNDVLLREFLRRLPDFDDMEAEDKAFAFIADYPDANRALLFFLQYPALSEADRLVVKRASELDGNNYELLSQAAEKLADRYPLAATLALRAMIDFTLTYARSSRYKHAARHVMECSAMDRNIADYGSVVQHSVYLDNLRKQHGKKQRFWDLIS